MNYSELNALLVGRSKDRKKYGHNTYLERRGENIALKYHSTDVVVFMPDGAIVLDSGGWQTVTTKERMNWGLAETNYHLNQRASVWYLDNGSSSYRFKDGLTIGASGKVSGFDPTGDPKKDRKLKAKIKKYALACKEAIPIDKPSLGDCLYCQAQTKEGQSLGDVFKDKEHIKSHIQEGYIVPSLVYRALKEANNTDTVIYAAFNKDVGFLEDVAKDRVYRHVYRYICKRMGFAG